MQSIFQLLLINALAMVWVNAVLLEVTHNENKYWICSINHKFTQEDQDVPFIFVGEIKQSPSEGVLRRDIRVITESPIKIGNNLPLARYDKKLLWGDEDEYPIMFTRPNDDFLRRLGNYIIVTQNRYAKVDTDTWNQIMQDNHTQLEQLEKAEQVITKASKQHP
ncbi:hypothetical protein PGT21_018692 [Puccinia graminis f. sp. tritici]|uniref:Uncharacterized protein n=1 Tax=Puccinia graminis f. sp. tritici TaxID=56615 RepID=A0A5B0QTE5_PUCGR|nr:hypothetical protein PGT21_018692 [Puccinia graminis f. sp. tritici]